MWIDTVTQGAVHCCDGVQEVEKPFYTEVSTVNTAELESRSVHLMVKADVADQFYVLSQCDCHEPLTL